MWKQHILAMPIGGFQSLLAECVKIKEDLSFLRTKAPKELDPSLTGHSHAPVAQARRSILRNLMFMQMDMDCIVAIGGAFKRECNMMGKPIISVNVDMVPSDMA